MIGTYSPANYTNTYDVIQLATNNIYYRRLYDKNKKLVMKLKESGK
jgi:ribosomal protein S4E